MTTKKDDTVIDFNEALASRRACRASTPQVTSSDNILDLCEVLAEKVWHVAKDEVPPPPTAPDPGSYAGLIAWFNKLTLSLTRIAFKGASDEVGFEAVDEISDELIAAAVSLSIPFAVPTDDASEKATIRERVAALLDPVMSLQSWAESAVDTGNVSEVEFEKTIAAVYACMLALEAFGGE